MREGDESVEEMEVSEDWEDWELADDSEEEEEEEDGDDADDADDDDPDVEPADSDVGSDEGSDEGSEDEPEDELEDDASEDDMEDVEESGEMTERRARRSCAGDRSPRPLAWENTRRISDKDRLTRGCRAWERAKERSYSTSRACSTSVLCRPVGSPKSRSPQDPAASAATEEAESSSISAAERFLVAIVAAGAEMTWPLPSLSPLPPIPSSPPRFASPSLLVCLPAAGDAVATCDTRMPCLPFLGSLHTLTTARQSPTCAVWIRSPSTTTTRAHDPAECSPLVSRLAPEPFALVLPNDEEEEEEAESSSVFEVPWLPGACCGAQLWSRCCSHVCSEWSNASHRVWWMRPSAGTPNDDALAAAKASGRERSICCEALSWHCCLSFSSKNWQSERCACAATCGPP